MKRVIPFFVSWLVLSFHASGDAPDSPNPGKVFAPAAQSNGEEQVAVDLDSRSGRTQKTTTADIPLRPRNRRRMESACGRPFAGSFA